MGPESGRPIAADLTADVDLRGVTAKADLHDPRQRAAVEAAICAVPGVLSARLVPGYEREIDELHVLTTLERAPKQTVRDVQSVLMARFGVSSDHRVVSVVPLDEGDGLLATASRAAIHTVGLVHSGLTVTAEVTLRAGDELHLGSAEGAASSSGRARAIAQATLAAVRPLLPADHLIEIEGVDLVQVLGRQVAVSLLQVRSARNESLLSGSALVREAPQDAVVRSVLDAVNRLLGEPV